MAGKWADEKSGKQANGIIKTLDRNGKLTPKYLKLAIQKLTLLFVVRFMQFDAVLSIGRLYWRYTTLVKYRVDVCVCVSVCAVYTIYNIL